MGTWLIVGFFSLYIGYPVPKPQTGAQEHQKVGEYTPQKPPMFPVTATPCQPAAYAEKGGPKENADDIWQKAVSPETWPNWAVVIAGLGAILVGLRTLGVIDRQTKATEAAAVAAKKSVELAEKEMVLLNRAYLITDGWHYRYDGQGNVTISFYILNPSGTAARIERVDTETRDIKDAQTCGFMLTPKERYKFSLAPQKYQKGDVFMISGRITYTDIFHRERRRRFAKMCYCTDTQGIGFYEPEGRGLNDEEEWDNQDS